MTTERDDNLGAEYSVCGSILIDARCLPDITSHVTEADFFYDTNRAIFRAAVELDKAGEVIDPVTILSKAGNVVSWDYLMDLMQVTGTAANAAVYAEQTRLASMRRSILSLSSDLAARTGPADDPKEVIADAVDALEAIQAQDTRQELATSGDTLTAYYRHRQKVDDGKGGYVPTGFKSLDCLLSGGMVDTGFYIIAARPGMGKTTFALSVADNVAEQSGPVLFVSLEMDEEQLAAKRLARSAGIGYDALMMGRLSDEERVRSAEHSAKLAKLPISFNKKPGATVEDIANMARKVRGLRLVVIDYFGLIHTTGKFKSKYEAATDTSASLKALARKLKLPVLCLAQLNRELSSRQDKRPQLSDLRDTGALEQDADGVVFLHCPSYYSMDRPDPWSPDPMEIIVAKNRHGMTGSCDAAFYRAVGRIRPAKLYGGNKSGYG